MENDDKRNELIARFNAGEITPDERAALEELILTGEVPLEALQASTVWMDKVERMTDPTPSAAADQNFYTMLAGHAPAPATSTFSWSWLSGWAWFPKFAAGAMLVVAGFAGGMLIQKNSGGHEVHKLTGEVAELKEMVMMSLLEKESATDRLKAVSLTSEIDAPSAPLTEALFKTLNGDPSVNVRLAALDALRAYAKSPTVREGLVRAIAHQDSPLVQAALADLMVALQEKSSVTALQKILQQKSTPKEVKKRIAETIKVLI